MEKQPADPTVSQTVAPLVRVVLDVAVQGSGADASAAEPTRFSFIYGIGPAGICGLEKALAGRTPGQAVQVEVTADTAAELLGHLAPALARSLGCLPPYRLTATVTALEQPSQREIIAEMARATECGCDCGCGCG